MLKYTICFIKQGGKILLLNREKPEWMGAWNGVGGKIEAGETPLQSIAREVQEETGMDLDVHTIKYKGDITWTDPEQSYYGGMYAFIAELPETYDYHTPKKTDEGILDWKDLNWILHPENKGIANLRYFLSVLFDDENKYEHKFVYENGNVITFSIEQLDQAVFSN